MESLLNLFKIFICFYLGSFTYITYQILFYYQKRFLLIKTIIFFLIIAILIIKASNTYNIEIFHMYICGYLLGIILAKKYLSIHLFTLNKNFCNSLLPLKKPLIKIIKIILLPSFYPIVKDKIKLYLFYKKYPHLKPKTIYELF